jgi:C1A family cysteine protease
MFKKLFYYLLPKRSRITSPEQTGGALEAKPDSRDYLASAVITSFPESFDLLGSITQVESQGIYNSCVSQAITTAVETYSKNYGYPHTLELSRMHLWNEGRKISGTFPDNRGMYIRDGWKATQKAGITIEKLFPYIPENMNQDIGIAASMFIYWYQPFNYYFIVGDATDKKNLIKDALYTKKVPVVFGVPISQQFCTLQSSFDYVYTPSANERDSFNHAMLIIGYDDKKDAFLIRNSWNSTWGWRGNVWADANWILTKGYEFSYPDKKN